MGLLREQASLSDVFFGMRKKGRLDPYMLKGPELK